MFISFIVLEAKSKTKTLESSMSGVSFLIHIATFLLCPCVAKGAGELSGASL